MHSLETMAHLNEMACIPKIENPKLHELAYIVQRLRPIGGFYRAALSFPLFFVFQPIGIMPPILSHVES